MRWPNVTLTQLPKFETMLGKWFKRPDIPIWITEYGYQTKPAQPKGVTLAQQRAYLREAINIAANDPRVQMFIWFILRDDPTSAWQSGLVSRERHEEAGVRHVRRASPTSTTAAARRSRSEPG